MMKTITFIIPYYGNFPNYFNLWLESAQANESIDFYIITDNQSILEMSVTHNIKLIHMTLDQIRKRTKSLWGGVDLNDRINCAIIGHSMVYFFLNIFLGMIFGAIAI